MGNSPSGNSELKDVIHGSSLPLSYSTRDERVEVTTTNAVPYRWICKMTIETQRGKKYSATGFKICIKPSLKHQVILTTGHSVFVEGSFAKRITVTFPGENSVLVTTQNLWAPEQFTQGKNSNFDFGVITLPGSSEDGFDWTTLLSDDELIGRPLSCCGYPVDQEKETMWISGGGVDTVTRQGIQYMYDSRSTSSGSPVYTWHKGYWMAVGIQCYSGNFNFAVRITVEVMRSVLDVVGFQLQYSLQSMEYKDTYLCTHMNTLDVSKEEEVITIGFQSGPIEPKGYFEIVPLSSKYQSVCVSPVPCKDLFLSLTTKTKNNDEVTVTDKTTELFLHHLEEGIIALESGSERGVHLSLNDMGLEGGPRKRTSVIENGNGSNKTVTCHYVSEKQEIRSTEKFILHSS